MIQQRSIATCIILTIVTCSIYGYYWVYCMANDLNTMTGDHSTSPSMVVVFSILTCGIYTWYWMYKQGERIDSMKMSRGIPASNSGVIYLILGVFGLGIVSYALIQDSINSLVIKY